MKIKDTAILFKTLSDETRLRILNLLNSGELCVCDVMAVLREPQSKISRHVAYLKRAGIVTGRKQGFWMYYQLSNFGVKIFRDLRSQISQVEELKLDKSELKRKNKKLAASCH